MPTHFDYEGHQVAIIPRIGKKGKTEYWVYIDQRSVFQVSKPDTAKRLATRFIDVLCEDQFLTRRQGKTTHLTNH